MLFYVVYTFNLAFNNLFINAINELIVALTYFNSVLREKWYKLQSTYNQIILNSLIFLKFFQGMILSSDFNDIILDKLLLKPFLNFLKVFLS